MSFETELLDQIGGASDAWDIRAMVRRCWLFDFDGAPVRLWHGQGVLTAGGYDWLGTIDPAGNDRMSAPAVKDGRDGASPQYRFTVPFIDRATFDGLRADQDNVRGRDLTCWHVIIGTHEGLRPGTALRFAYRLTMQRAEFSDGWQGGPANGVRNLSMSILARAGEVGRSKAPNGTWSDTVQRERARVLGVSEDDGCVFVASNANRTYRIG